MPKQNTLTQEHLKELLHYDPDTGEFTWITPGPGRRRDKVGSVTKNGYVTICVDKTAYLAHRLAWFYMTGNWPRQQIDHKNGDRVDNRFANLRETTWQGNQQNLPAVNKVGKLRGVRKHCNPTLRTPKYQAGIKHNQVHIYLGLYDTEEEAHAAYLKAKAALHTFQPTPRAA